MCVKDPATKRDSPLNSMALMCGPKSSEEGGWRSTRAFQVCTAPVEAPAPTTQRCGSASAVQKYPPMNSVVSCIARALTRSSRFTCQGVGAPLARSTAATNRSEEHTSELQSLAYLVC